MSDKKFKDAHSSLSFSQGLMEQMRAAQQPPQGPEMAPEASPAPEQATPPQAPVAPPVEQPAEAPVAPVEQLNTPPEEDSKDLGSTLKAGMQGMEKFFSSIGDYFKNEEQRGEVSRQKEEETMKKLKGIEKSLKEIVEE